MNIFLSVLKKRNFWPLFGAMSLGAFNDNFMRQALISFIAYGPIALAADSRSVMSSLATALMILPFFLFSSMFGQLADRHPKSAIVKVAKIFELVVMAFAALSFIFGHIYGLFALLFLMGTQSAFFGPVKYGLLPEVLEERQLMAGNSLFSGATFIAIVLGTALGSYLINLPIGTKVLIPLGLVLVGGGGCLFALLQPRSEQADKTVVVEPRIWLSTRDILRYARSRQDIWLTLLAISWFWAMGSILLTQMPVLVATFMGGRPEINTLFVTSFALGVAIGSLVANFLTKGKISVSLVPGSALCLTVLMLLLGHVVSLLPSAEPMSMGFSVFFQSPLHILTWILCFLVSVVGGVFVVPLNALLQHRSETSQRARVIAANNIMNSLFMVIGNVIVMILISLGASVAYVFLLIGLSAGAVTLITLYFLSAPTFRFLLRLTLSLLYRPKIKGLEHLASVSEGPAMVISNHLSFVDVAFLVAYIPRKLTFAIDYYQAQKWWVRFFANFYKTIPINPVLPMGARDLVAAVENGEMLVIFPEGHLNNTGAIMKVYEGPALVAVRSNCPIVSVVLKDLEYTRFGRLRHIMRRRPVKLSVGMTVFPPVLLSEDGRHWEDYEANLARSSAEAAEGRADEKSSANRRKKDFRRKATLAIYELMAENKFQSQTIDVDLFSALTAAAKRFGPGREIIEDVSRRVLTYAQLIRASKVLGRYFKDQKIGQNIGVLLPNSIPMTALLYGLWADGKTPVMLNYSQGRRHLKLAVEKSGLTTIITSRKFIEQGQLEPLLVDAPAAVMYLEDLSLSLWDKIKGLLWRPTLPNCDAPAAILFTSGSEGVPKGVVLSHKNMVADIWQARTIVEIVEDDNFFNAMPGFHAFGLNVGVVLPLILGLRLYLHPSPLQIKVIPELVYDTRATVIITSDNFAAAWGQKAHPFDFHRVRLILVGAEKMKKTTFDLYCEKLGVRLFEGYGVTEGSPILAVNCLMHNKFGSVGHVIPGLKWRIEPVEGLDGPAGRFLVKGPNMMLGYLDDEKAGQINYLGDEWYDTGDIAEVDDEGLLWIRGRFKRFAKLSGEMISLSVIEEIARTVWPELPMAVLSMHDPKKGERLVLVHQGAKPDMDLLRQALREAGLTDLSWPRLSLAVPEIPITPLGKADIPGLTEIAEQIRKENLKNGIDLFNAVRSSSGEAEQDPAEGADIG